MQGRHEVDGTDDPLTPTNTPSDDRESLNHSDDSSDFDPQESTLRLGTSLSSSYGCVVFSLSGNKDEVLRYAREILFNHARGYVNSWKKIDKSSGFPGMPDHFLQYDFNVLKENTDGIAKLLWCMCKATGAIHLETPAIIANRAAEKALTMLDEPFTFKINSVQAFLDDHSVPREMMTDAEREEYAQICQRYSEAQELERFNNSWAGLFYNMPAKIAHQIGLDANDEQETEKEFDESGYTCKIL